MPTSPRGSKSLVNLLVCCGKCRLREQELHATGRTQRGGPVLALPQGIQVDRLLLQEPHPSPIPPDTPLPRETIRFSWAASYEVGRPAASAQSPRRATVTHGLHACRRGQCELRSAHILFGTLMPPPPMAQAFLNMQTMHALSFGTVEGAVAATQRILTLCLEEERGRRAGGAGAWGPEGRGSL